MRISKIKEHVLISDLIEELQELLKKTDIKNPNKAPVLKPFEEYSSQVMKRIGDIVSCIDQLHLSLELLSGFRKGKNKKYNRHDYITFGVENYLIRFSSVYDRCLRLTNYVYGIGLPERECRENTIIKNANIKGTKVAESLKEIQKIRKCYANDRNKIAHSESYSDEELFDLELFYIVEDEQGFDSSKYRHFYEPDANRYIAVKRKEFGDRIEHLENCLDVFFSAIRPFVLDKISFYRESSSS